MVSEILAFDAVLPPQQKPRQVSDVVAVKKPDRKIVRIDANTTPVEESVHRWRQRKHIRDVIMARMWPPEWSDMSAIDGKQRIIMAAINMAERPSYGVDLRRFDCRGLPQRTPAGSRDL